MNKRKLHLVTVIFFVLLAAIQVNPASPAEKMVMVTVKGEDVPEGKFYSLIYTEAFKRIGMELEYKQYPPKRCSLMADAGEVDGEMERVFDYGQSHPNLVRIDEPLKTVTFSAFTVNPDISLDGWESLRETGYKVDYRRGLKKCEEKLPGYVDEKNLYAVSETSGGLKKLAAGRIDLYIDREANVLPLLRYGDFSSLNIRMAGVMEKTTTHGFLHKKHGDTALRLSSVLKEMRKEGLFEKYMIASGFK